VRHIAEFAPARLVLEAAEAANRASGHDNAGSLSYSHGFLPRCEPLKQLPTSHRAWDEIAAAIPYLFRTYSMRRAVNELPILSAAADALSDEYLLRASSLFSILAHAYWYAEPEPPADGIPPQIQIPWEEITLRLDRPAPHLSFIDLNSHNWHFIDPNHPEPFSSQNLKLAIPMIGNEDERRFQMTPVELLYQFAPFMDAILNAQEAVLRDDSAALEAALVFISEALKFQTFHTLMKVNPNPYSGDQYINPVVWGKTAALFASPFQSGNSVPGPSGTAIPSFTSLDIFFGRKLYHSSVGTQTDVTRKWFPKHWRDWLNALETVSVPEYIARKGNTHLRGIFKEARDAYAGDTGMLSRHRLKAYGFLDLSFKAGRVKTLGGTSGSYSERVWDRMATELDEARLERYGMTPQTTHKVPVARVDTLQSDEQGQHVVRRIVFDISNTGIRYAAGDRCGILPQNSAELVEKTLNALRATGNERVQLNAAWRWHVNLRSGFEGAVDLPLRTLLTFGRIRPVDRITALHLYALTKQDSLLRILDHWAEDQWELWDLLNMLANAGYNPKQLWKGVVGNYEHICRIIPPERWRLYSISSSMQQNPDELALTIGLLHYQTAATQVSREDHRWGAGSRFLTDLAHLAKHETENTHRVSIKVVHPPRFKLPLDSTRPIVMFAGGTGIAPMLGLIEERVRTQATGENLLFFGTRRREDLYYQHELEPHVAAGDLDVHVAFSRDDVDVHFNTEHGAFEFTAGKRGHLDHVMLQPDHAHMLWEMLRSPRDGGKGAYLYICGQTALATTVLDALKAIIARYIDGEAADQMLYRLIGEDRLMLEIFTTYSGAHFDAEKRRFPVSDVVLHNDDVHGYWMVISGRVYDLNVLNHMHPGGGKILQSYAGMDGTVAYQKVEHHINSEVDAMLSMYELGVLHVPEFGREWGVAIMNGGLRLITMRDVYTTWVNVLYTVVEIENAVMNDFRIRAEPLTDVETPDHVWLTPNKVYQLGLAHERLVTSYLDHVLGEPIQTLWAMTIGLCGQNARDVRWMRSELDAIRSEQTAQRVIELGRTVRVHIQQDDGRFTLDPSAWERQYAPFCDALETADRGLLRNLKELLRDGVQVFEEFEQHAVQHGSERLLNALERLPAVLQNYYQHTTQLSL
jgi:sulfite reductase alpha subunit-like flavoprotein